MQKPLALMVIAISCACSRTSGGAPGASSAPAETASARRAPLAASGPTSGSAPPDAGVANGKKWNFEGDASNASPAGFSFARTGRGREGRWVVRDDGDAKVLAQLDADDTSFRFPMAVANEPLARDVRVSVRCKMISGEVDRACGLVARYADRDNYFVTRANALENNVRLYTVRHGKREEIASYSVPMTPNVWHDFRFELRGEKLEVFWDGTRVLEHRDATFMAAGRAGVWTKADSVTYFDDFVVEAL